MVLNMYADCTSERLDMKQNGGSCDDVRNHKNLGRVQGQEHRWERKQKGLKNEGGNFLYSIFVVYRLYEMISQRLKAKKKRNVQN